MSRRHPLAVPNDQGEVFVVYGVGQGAINSPVSLGRRKIEPPNMSIHGFVAHTGKSYLCEDVEIDPLQYEWLPSLASEVVVPIIKADSILGVLSAESSTKGAFDERNLIALEGIANRLADLLEPDESPPSTLSVVLDPGAAPAEAIGELFAELSRLYRQLGGSGITFSTTDIRCPEPAL